MSVAAIAWNQLLLRLKVSAQITAAQFGVPDLPPAALFVTWNYKHHLRGCIGTFSPGPIETTVRRYATIAAFEDTRFAPITVQEVPYLDVAVTLLGPLEPCELLDWEIGQHGVKAEFKGGFDATFLPEVAEEQGWNKQQTLEALADKAGVPYSEPLRFYRYPGTKYTLSYEEYKQLAS